MASGGRVAALWSAGMETKTRAAISQAARTIAGVVEQDLSRVILEEGASPEGGVLCCTYTNIEKMILGDRDHGG
jgi:hypothetical protein